MNGRVSRLTERLASHFVGRPDVQKTDPRRSKRHWRRLWKATPSKDRAHLARQWEKML